MTLLYLFFLLQVNPFLYYFYGINQGVGAGSVRSALFIAGSFFIGLNAILASNFVSRVRVPFGLVMFALYSIVAVFYHLIYDQAFVFLYMFPLFEYISVYLLCFVIGPHKINYFFTEQLPFFVYTALPFASCFYVYSVISGTSFGPFKANIGSFDVNRWPDFITPLFAFISFSIKPSFLMFISALILITITLYRTVYLAILCMILFLFILSLPRWRNRIVIKWLYRVKLTQILLISLPFIVIAVGAPYLSFDNLSQVPDFSSFLSSLLSRFYSLFQPEPQTANSLSSRLDQIPVLISAVTSQLSQPLNFLVGSNPLLEGQYSFNYAFFPLVSLLLYGWPITLVVCYHIFSAVYPIILSMQTTDRRSLI